MTTMRQVFLIAPRRTEIREVPVPEPGPGQVLVRIRACGVCTSEVHKWEGRYERFPASLGHEPAGEVAAVGPGVDSWQPGDRVTGLCEYGTMAEYGLAREDRLVRLPDGLTYHEGLGEPLGCVMSGMWRTGIKPGDRVAVVGLGFMGLLALAVARLQGPSRLIGIDPRRETHDLAKKLGADETFVPADVPDDYLVRGWDEFGRGLDTAIEASGTQAGLDLAGEIPRLHGTLSIVGWHTGGDRRVNMDLWNIKALTVINAHERRDDKMLEAMKGALAVIGSGRLSLSALISHRYGLDGVDRAFADLLAKPAGFVKAVIEPGHDSGNPNL